MKTLDVKLLVNAVLAEFSPPYSPHVIDEVFHAIEKNPQWKLEYESLCSKLGKAVVNNWCGNGQPMRLGKQVRSRSIAV